MDLDTSMEVDEDEMQEEDQGWRAIYYSLFWSFLIMEMKTRSLNVGMKIISVLHSTCKRVQYSISSPFLILAYK